MERPTTARLIFAVVALPALLALARVGESPLAHAADAKGERFVGAGILPFAEHEGTPYVLLGREDRRGWTGFGGAPMKVTSLSDPAKRWEKPTETAVRETFEELRMVVAPDELERGLRPGCEIRSQNGFVTYVARIEYRTERVFRDRPVTAGYGYSEKTDYRWVSLEAARAAAASKDGRIPGLGPEDLVWRRFAVALNDAFSRPAFAQCFKAAGAGP